MFLGGLWCSSKKPPTVTVIEPTITELTDRRWTLSSDPGYVMFITTSKFKILQIKKREYRDGIKSRETRPGWGRHTMYTKHV